MDGSRFDAWTRRRFGLVAGGAVAALLSLAATEFSGTTRANKPKHKLKRNAFGCVGVGGRCRGRNKNCCSGVCAGKRPKQGEKDTSRCKAHDTGVREIGAGGCRAQDESLSEDVYCTTTAGETGLCWRTTGDAGYCGLGAECIPGGCRKDADCVGACGAGAACIALPNVCGGAGVRCFGIGACDGP